MNDGTFRKLLTQLPSLTQPQLSELHKRTGALVSVLGQARGGDRIDDWLLEGMLVELRNRGQGQLLPPLPVIAGLKAYRTYAKHAERVRAYLEENVGQSSRVQKRALGIIASRCLARQLSTWTEVTLATMLRYVGEVPRAMEKAFPGYAAAGMMGKLLASHEIRQQSEDK